MAWRRPLLARKRCRLGEGAMPRHRIADWDNAYANGANIAGSDRLAGRLGEPAQAFRDVRCRRRAGTARHRLWRPAAQSV